METLQAEYLVMVADSLRMLAHPVRLQIVELLERTDAQPVHEIMDVLALPQAVASQHLIQMRRAGLVKAERRGKEVWYSIADKRCVSILNCIRQKGGKPCQGA